MPVTDSQYGRTITETRRLLIREMVPSDFDALCRILCDEEAMRAAYGNTFSIEEARNCLWAVVLKETGEMIGQCGLTMQSWREKELLEIGYLFQKACWHKGYAAEAAAACRDYAFSALHADRVYSIIRDTHTASQNVAVRNGMKIVERSCARC